MPDVTKWNLTNIPPKGDPAVSDFAYNLFEIARFYKVERLNKHQQFLNNFALYRGYVIDHLLAPRRVQQSSLVNLYFANIERTVSNITARQPVGEVVDMDGNFDDAERILSMALGKWWNDTNQQRSQETCPESLNFETEAAADQTTKPSRHVEKQRVDDQRE